MMGFSWLSILEIFRLKLPETDLSRAIRNWDEIEIECIAVLTIITDSVYHVKVDAFPLFYEFSNALILLKSKEDVAIEIGEGLWLIGSRVMPDSIRFELQFHPGDEISYGSKVLTFDETFLFLVTKIGEMVQLFAGMGQDLSPILNKFPLQKFPDRRRRAERSI